MESNSIKLVQCLYKSLIGNNKKIRDRQRKHITPLYYSRAEESKKEVNLTDWSQQVLENSIYTQLIPLLQLVQELEIKEEEERWVL
jgi:hypothetical protein